MAKQREASKGIQSMRDPFHERSGEEEAGKAEGAKQKAKQTAGEGTPVACAHPAGRSAAAWRNRVGIGPQRASKRALAALSLGIIGLGRREKKKVRFGFGGKGLLWTGARAQDLCIWV